MADITMCMGGCPMESECVRKNATPDRFQSYFAGCPYRDGHCNEFWQMSNSTVFHPEIPKMPEPIFDSYGQLRSLTSGKCPHCNKFVDIDDDLDECEYCGQSLSWGLFEDHYSYLLKMED